MNAEQKEKWARALESDEYVQGRDGLKSVASNGERYCCLGVATELFGTPIAGEDPVVGCYNEYLFDVGGRFERSSVCPPPGWMGLTHAEIGSFIKANDREKKSFKEIAEMVRALPETE
jgi:hypothetical protein